MPRWTTPRVSAHTTLTPATSPATAFADLIVACWGGSVVSFLRGIGNGTFAPLVNYTVGAAPISVVARDFNGDGRLDAAVADLQ